MNESIIHTKKQIKHEFKQEHQGTKTAVQLQVSKNNSNCICSLKP